MFIKELCRLCNILYFLPVILNFWHKKYLGNYTVPSDIGNITNTNASKSSINNSTSTLQITQQNIVLKHEATPAHERLIFAPDTAKIFEQFDFIVNDKDSNSEKSSTVTGTKCNNNSISNETDNDENVIPKFPGKNQIILQELGDEKEDSCEPVIDQDDALVLCDDFFPTLCFFPNLAFS